MSEREIRIRVRDSGGAYLTPKGALTHFRAQSAIFNDEEAVVNFVSRPPLNKMKFSFEDNQPTVPTHRIQRQKKEFEG